MPRVLILSAEFYPHISALLKAGALAALELAGAETEEVQVPGAFEIPAAIAMAHASGRYDGYVALGCVIRGETTHYDYVCGESARGINELAIKHRLAIGYGILTVEHEAQALHRADPAKGNKGAAAVEACLAMLKLKTHWGVA
jgi:6,7-dimethyl-8-ribityllumazine synthase